MSPEAAVVQLGDLLDLAGSPGLVEERQQWAVEPQYGESAFARRDLDPDAVGGVRTRHLGYRECHELDIPRVTRVNDTGRPAS